MAMLRPLVALYGSRAPVGVAVGPGSTSWRPLPKRSPPGDDRECGPRAVGHAQVQAAARRDHEACRQRVVELHVERAVGARPGVLDHDREGDQVAGLHAVQVGVDRRRGQAVGVDRARSAISGRSRRGEAHRAHGAREGGARGVRRHDPLRDAQDRLGHDDLDDLGRRDRLVVAGRLGGMGLVRQQQLVRERLAARRDAEQEVDDARGVVRVDVLRPGEAHAVRDAVRRSGRAPGRRGRRTCRSGRTSPSPRPGSPRCWSGRTSSRWSRRRSAGGGNRRA